MSGERRREMLAWARSADAIVIEDDYDAEFRYDREPVRAMQGLDPGRVAYVGTIARRSHPRFGSAGSSCRTRWPARSRR
jgi:GntR family transcriptional regulator/MocR family aminotransferase